MLGPELYNIIMKNTTTDLKSIYLSKSHACHRINTQDAPWPRTNKNMNATSSSNLWERVRAKKIFLKMDIRKNVANQIFQYSCETRLYKTYNDPDEHFYIVSNRLIVSKYYNNKYCQ